MPIILIGDNLVKGVQCYEFFGGIALKNHTFFIFFHFSLTGALIIRDTNAKVCVKFLDYYLIIVTRCYADIKSNFIFQLISIQTYMMKYTYWKYLLYLLIF